MTRRVRAPVSGRPHRPSRPLGESLGYRERIAWLLRVNRRFGPAAPGAPLAAFATELSGRGCPVTAGQVSRWESGRVPVPHRAVVAYESALGLRHSSLVAVIDAVHRQHTQRLAPSGLDRQISPDDLRARDRAEELLDRAVFEGRMEAADWDELTVLLTTFTNVLMPGRLWDRLAQRLLTEQLVADGDAWRLRSESTHRLLWLPASRAHVVAACAALVRDPASQIVIEPMVLLDVVDDPAVTALLLGQLAEPVNERVLRGALLAGVAKVRHGHFRPDELRRVSAAVLDLLTGSGRSEAVRPLAGELLGRLPPDLLAHTTRRLRKTLTADPALASAVADGRTGGSPGMVDRIAGSTLSRTAAYADGAPDELLARMIDEMLFSANADVRLHAAQLVGATPFRHALADAYCAELGKPSVARDATLAGALLEALPFVAAPRHRPTVEAIVAAPGLPAATVSAAAWSIAHLPGHSSEEFWNAALRRRGPCLSGLVYALGMAGQHARLNRIRQDADLPADTRVAARWWSGLPADLLHNARR